MSGGLDCSNYSFNYSNNHITYSDYMFNIRWQEREVNMGFFSSLFGQKGLTNTCTNMKNPLGYDKCMALVRAYDNYGGYKIPARLLIGTPTGPGMELYEVKRGPSIVEDGEGDYVLCRGVIFAQAYENDRPIIKLRVIEFEDYGDGGCPSFSVVSEMRHVEGDLYKSITPFEIYKDGQEFSAVAEVNWNSSSNEFVYREIYTPA